MNNDFKRVFELESGKQYLGFFGNDTSNLKNHGYYYEIRDEKLFNLTKEKFSNTINDFYLEVNNAPKREKYHSLDYAVDYRQHELKIGCQSIAPSIALEIAYDIIEYYSKESVR
jgi:hypothetical protein